MIELTPRQQCPRPPLAASLHHFVPYNRVAAAGCPSFAGEPASDAMAQSPEALPRTKQYVRNLIFRLRTGSLRALPAGVAFGVGALEEALSFPLRI
jgi:hypothetical protein